MPKTKRGEKINWQEFFSRWRAGIENLTPLQKTINECRGTFVTFLGFLVSFIAVIIMREKIGLLSYGLILIFLGSIITTGIKYVGLRQQLKMFKDIESQIEDYEK